MDLKYTDTNGEIILARKLNYVNLFFKIVKIELKNESYKLFFEEDAMSTLKRRLSITFSSLAKME